MWCLLASSVLCHSLLTGNMTEFCILSERAKWVKHDDIIATIPRSLYADLHRVKVLQKGAKKIPVGVVFSCQ